jgi:bifunctional non-homologous end joining protein LigD
MLAVPHAAPFSSGDWWFEVKWDGVRVMLCWDGTAVRAWGRRGTDVLASYPELGSFRWPRPCVLDGEVVAFDGDTPSFERLQARINLTGSRAVAASKTVPVGYVAFDILYDGEEIIGLPIEHRRERLATAAGWFTPSDQIDGEGEALFRAVRERGLEGVVAKRKGSPYRPGARSGDWRKVVVIRRTRALVCGFLPGEGSRSSTFGSLVLGQWHAEQLRFIGSVGSGFSRLQLEAIRSALDEIRTADPPFEPLATIRPAVWVEPAVVVRVEFKSWTSAGRLRAPVFRGLDLVPSVEVTWEAEGPEAT